MRFLSRLILLNLQTNIVMPNLMLGTSKKNYLFEINKYYPHEDKFIPKRWIKADPQYNTKCTLLLHCHSVSAQECALVADSLS